jgi:hypothetical protein
MYPVYNKKANGMGLILPTYYACLLKHVIEGTIEGGLEVTGRQ